MSNTTEQARVCRDLLIILSNSLFSADLPQPEITPELRSEAIKQAVYPFLPLAKDARRYTILSKNVSIHHQHQELHGLMTENNIPYVVLKGSASARYYPEPMVRTAGDVDFLVCPEDFERAKTVLASAGFSGEEDNGGNHVAFHREPHCTWELHRHINGGSDTVAAYLRDVVSNAVEYDGMMAPSDFHHCLIIQCHMASHLNSEGIGLRHLCDWAVFVNSTDVSRWEKELKECGLWQFARIMSQLSAIYLHIPVQPWFGEPNEELLALLMDDILCGGNFGNKDADRYRQIKYLIIPEDKVLSGQSRLHQIRQAIADKAGRENRSRGQIVLEYAGLLLSGKRKPDTARTLSEAKRRRELYSNLKIFDREA